MAKKTPPKAKTTRRGLPPWVMVGSIILIMVIAALVYFLGRSIPNAPRTPTPTPTLVPDITVDDAFFLFGEKGVFFLDVRPAADWKAYHIEKSVNIPIAELASRLSEVSRTDTIVVVDFNYGEAALDAVDTLKQAGFDKVTAVRGGIQAWVNKRYPLIGTAPY